MQYFLKAVILTLAAAVPMSVHAYTIDNKKIKWEFVNSTFKQNHDRYGIPDDDLLIDLSGTFNSQFVRRVAASLPERKNNANDSIAQTHVTLTADTEVSLSFIHEGAGYRNAVGYFTYDSNNIPTSRAEIAERIVFPNTSYPNRRTSGLSRGDSISLGSFESGTSIGFVLIANGFHGKSGVKTNIAEDWIFYNIDALNDLGTSVSSGGSSATDARYIVERDATNRVKFEGANPGLGDDGVNQTDTFVINGSATALPVVVKTKAGKRSAKSKLSVAGDNSLDDLGFRVTLLSRESISAAEAKFTFTVTSVNNRHALSHVEFFFHERAQVTQPSSKYYTATRAGAEPEQPNYITKQSVTWYDADTDSVLITWEDINRNFKYSDHDFNDLIIAIKTTETNAVEVGDFPATQDPSDRDSDGIFDDVDEFPDDPERASTSYYPRNGSQGTLAYEDRWPEAADGDINDVVLNYNIREVRDSNGLVKEMIALFDQRSRGGALATGFAIHLPGISPDAVESATVSHNDGAAASVITDTVNGSTAPVLETEQTEAVFDIFVNSHDNTVLEDATAECAFWNTQPECPNYAAHVYELRVVFAQAQTLTAPPYNPFIFRSFARGFEVHLPDHVPSDKANLDLFGIESDASNPDQGTYYRTDRNIPWVIHIPEIWQYPCERCNVLNAYPDLKGWITSGGTSNKDWYKTNLNSEYLYDQ